MFGTEPILEYRTIATVTVEKFRLCNPNVGQCHRSDLWGCAGECLQCGVYRLVAGLVES